MGLFTEVFFFLFDLFPTLLYFPLFISDELLCIRDYHRHSQCQVFFDGCVLLSASSPCEHSYSLRVLYADPIPYRPSVPSPLELVILTINDGNLQSLPSSLHISSSISWLENPGSSKESRYHS